jgi:hypothetical protein
VFERKIFIPESAIIINTRAASAVGFLEISTLDHEVLDLYRHTNPLASSTQQPFAH